MGWTKHQQQAIKVRGSNVLVSAGAGSGKTSVLTARVLDLLDTVDIERMLILTFTIASAADMKQKIREKLSQQIKQGQTHLIRQLAALPASSIQTFDSFIFSIIDRHKLLLGLTNITIIDVTECERLRDECANEVVLAALKEKQDIINPLIEELGDIDHLGLVQLVISSAKKLDNIINRENFFNTCIDSFYSQENYQKLIAQYFKQLQTMLDNIINVASYAANQVDDIKYHQYLEKLCLCLKVDISKIEDLPALPRFSISKNHPDHAIARSYSDNIKNYYRYFKTMFTSKVGEQTFNHLKSRAAGLIYLLKHYDKCLFEKKCQLGAFEFNDLTAMAISILENNEHILEFYREKYQQIIVDETQDNNNLNEYVISLLEQNNVFSVGDIKQSIYRFRNSNPELFKDKYQRYRINDGGIKIDFQENFRSRNELTSAINIIFNFLMDQDYGGADYRESHNLIAANENYKPAPSTGLRILTYDRDRQNAKESFEKEAFIVANKIKHLINNEQVTERDGSIRPFNYDDIAILIATRKNFKILERVLSFYNIPCTKASQNALVDIDLIPLVSIIRLIKYYRDRCQMRELINQELYALLRSFLFEFDDDTVINFVFLNAENKTMSKVVGILKYLATANFPLDQLLSEVINRFNYLERLYLLPSFRSSLKKITRLSTIIGDKVSNGYYQLDDLIVYLDYYIKKKDEGLEEKLLRQKGAVSIMTIHTSKGLEFPAVFLMDTNKQFNTEEIKIKHPYSSSYHFLFPIEGQTDTFLHMLHKSKIIQEVISEQIRLFYVALTRAKEYCYIIAAKFSAEDLVNQENIVPITKVLYRSFSKFLFPVANLMEPYFELQDVTVNRAYQSVRKSITLPLAKEINLAFISFTSLPPIKKVAIKDLGEFIDQQLLTEGIMRHRYLESLLPEQLMLELELPFANSLVNPRFFQELPLYDVNNDSVYRIDLLIEDDYYLRIIDYKLSGINDANYIQQLSHYCSILSLRSNKPIKIYLYSILAKTLNEIVLPASSTV